LLQPDVSYKGYWLSQQRGWRCGYTPRTTHIQIFPKSNMGAYFFILMKHHIVPLRLDYAFCQWCSKVYTEENNNKKCYLKEKMIEQLRYCFCCYSTQAMARIKWYCQLIERCGIHGAKTVSEKLTRPLDFEGDCNSHKIIYFIWHFR
jgi:hypothetical protein